MTWSESWFCFPFTSAGGTGQHNHIKSNYKSSGQSTQWSTSYLLFDTKTAQAKFKTNDKFMTNDAILCRAIGNRSNSDPEHFILMRAFWLTRKYPRNTSWWATRRSFKSITRNEERVRKRIYWPGIRKTVTKRVQWCNVVWNLKNSPLYSNTAPLGRISVNQPFTFWAMDYMRPLPETSRGNKCIPVVVDHLTKFCEAFTTSYKKASRFAPLLVSRILYRFGPHCTLFQIRP
jgi:hypothetical protein